MSNSRVTEAVTADAIAAHATESSGHGKPVHTHCENCGTALDGPYCHQCGQHDIDFHRSFGHMFLEALENFLHFDAKFFRNIVALLFRPGGLSVEFNAGKRAAQMPPFRLYLFISVLFFFIRFLNPEPAGDGKPIIKDSPAAQLVTARQTLAQVVQELADDATDPAAKQRLQATATALDDPAPKKITISDEQLRDLPSALAKQIRQALAAEPTQQEKNVLTASAPIFKTKFQQKNARELERYFTEKGQYAFAHQHEIKEAFIHALPKMLLFCLPLFALYARVLFRRTGYVYLQHFIVALHYHTFVYLWWLVARGWTELIGLRAPGLAGLMAFGAWLWMILYPFIMMRRLFGQSWKRTVFKTIMLAGCYGFTLGLGFLFTLLLVFLMV